MILKGFEMSALSGLPISGATVELFTASDLHPNPTAALTSTPTDAQGMWQFIGLVDGDYDVKVSVPGESRVKWLKGKSRLSPYMVATPKSNNLIANGDYRVDLNVGPYTSTGSRNSNDVYVMDVFNLLSDGNNIVNVSQESTFVPVGALNAMKMTVTTANKKFGKAYFLPQKDAAAIIGGVASVSVKLATTAAKIINKARVGILSWNSTADAITSALVAGGSWGASGANPTWAANWTLENTPTDLALTTAYQTFKVENVPIDTASAKNVAVVIWCDDVDAAINDELFIADLCLVEGETAYDLQDCQLADSIRQVQAFFCKSFKTTTQPAQNTGEFHGAAVTTGAVNFGTSAYFPVRMRSVPAITTYNPAAANALWRDGGAGADRAITVAAISEGGIGLTHQGGAGVAGNLTWIHWTADSRL